MQSAIDETGIVADGVGMEINNQNSLGQNSLGVQPPYAAPALQAPVSLVQPPDTFTPSVTFSKAPEYGSSSPMVSGRYCPGGTAESAVTVEVAGDGRILQETLSGPQVIGLVDVQGNYRMMNGKTGNIFVDKELRFDHGHGDNPFLQALRSTERQRAIMGSKIPGIRCNLTGMGIDGRGIKIGIIDPYQEDKPKPSPGQETNGQAGADDLRPKRWKLSDHTKTVATAVNDPAWGVAPGAQVMDVGYIPNRLKAPEIDDPGVFSRFIVQERITELQERGNQIRKLIALNDPALRVVNMTQGFTKSILYKDTLKVLAAEDENGNYKYPAIRQAILGPAATGGMEDRAQAVIRFVDNLFDNNPGFQAAHAQFIEATRQAAGRGLILVAATGNEHDGWNYKTPLPPGAEMDYFAKSPYLISVAACNTNQTPGNPADDRVSIFSSRGDGQLYNPTITAPGDEMGVPRREGSIGANLVVSGTSFSTPFTCGVIVLMLQRNPNLTFDQVKTILQQTATPLAGYTVAEQGAGILNPEQVVTAAGSLAPSGPANAVGVPGLGVQSAWGLAG